MIAQVVALADGGVVRMTGERAAAGVELPGINLAPQVACGGELDNLLRLDRLYLSLLAAVVQKLVLRTVDDGEGAQALNGYTVASFGELVAYLVEYMWQHRLDGGLADAAALDDGGGELLEVLLREHNFKVKSEE